MKLAEKEIERLISVIIQGSDFEGKVFSVGGFVRDELLGVPSKDLDVVIEEDGGAERLSALIHSMGPDNCSKPYLLGAGYPIWHLSFRGNIYFKGSLFETMGGEIDLADTQKESFPDPETRQRITQYGDIGEDIRRRDFTINMLLRDLTSGKILDMAGTSLKDLKDGIIRGHPLVDWKEILSDDPLRMLRAIRFKVKYGFQLDPRLGKVMEEMSSRITIISSERVRDEMIKIMDQGKLAEAIECNQSLWKHILPELFDLQGLAQNPEYHAEGDVFIHTLMVLKESKSGVVPQLSALCHDLGKLKAFENEDGKISFRNHAVYSGDLTEPLLRKLKFDLDTVRTVKKIVDAHMRPLNLEESTTKAIRKFIRHCDQYLDYVLDLADADSLGRVPRRSNVPILRGRIKEILESPIPVKKTPILNGHEIMELLKAKPGPIIREVGSFLLDLADELAEKGMDLEKESAIEAVTVQFPQSS